MSGNLGTGDVGGPGKFCHGVAVRADGVYAVFGRRGGDPGPREADRVGFEIDRASRTRGNGELETRIRAIHHDFDCTCATMQSCARPESRSVTRGSNGRKGGRRWPQPEQAHFEGLVQPLHGSGVAVGVNELEVGAHQFVLSTKFFAVLSRIFRPVSGFKSGS